MSELRGNEPNSDELANAIHERLAGQKRIIPGRQLTPADTVGVLAQALREFRDSNQRKRTDGRPLTDGAIHQMAYRVIVQGSRPERETLVLLSAWLGFDQSNVQRLRPSRRKWPGPGTIAVDPSGGENFEDRASKGLIYHFSTAPVVIIAASPQEGGRRNFSNFDFDAWQTIKRDMGTTWSLLEPHRSGMPGTPTDYRSQDLILIGGPNNNHLADQFHIYAASVEGDGFFFFKRKLKATLPIGHRPIADGPRDFVISHTDYLNMEIMEPGDSKTDYGIFFVGQNPEVDCRLIAVAGLGSPGSAGAAQAVCDSSVQGWIAHQLRIGKQYVSGLVKCEYDSEDRVRLLSVLLSDTYLGGAKA